MSHHDHRGTEGYSKNISIEVNTAVLECEILSLHAGLIYPTE